jgi:hypothetical protein
MADEKHHIFMQTAFNITLPPLSGSSSGAPKLNLSPTVMTKEMSDVSYYLQNHNIHRAGKNVQLDTGIASPKMLAQRLVRELKLTSSEALVATWIREEIKNLPDMLTIGREGAAEGSGGLGSPPNYQLSYNFVPITGHVDLKTHETSTDKPAHQLAFAANIQVHPDGEPGPELAWQVQVQTDGNSFSVASIMQGVQASWVIPFLDGALQIAALANAAVGVTKGQQSVSGDIPMLPTVQVGVGGQATYTIPGTGGKLQVGFQVPASITSQSGGATTADLSLQGFLQIQWH